MRDVTNELYHLIIGNGKKADTPTVESIAADIGVTQGAVYKWLENENPISLTSFVSVYRSCGDHLVPALKCLVRTCTNHYELTAVTRNHTCNGTVTDELLGIVSAMGMLAERTREYNEDGIWEQEEINILLDSALELKRANDDYIAELKNMGAKIKRGES